MAKAVFKCEKCNKIKTINFKPGEKFEEPVCDCGEKMKRQYGTANVGYIEEDDILRAGFMMTYQSGSVCR